MPEEKEYHRRSIRLHGADYSEPGAYFITICAAERRNILGKIENGKVALSGLGEIVSRCWIQIPKHFSAARMEEFVVMPNHLHGIIGLTVGARYIMPSHQRTRNTEGFQKPTRGSVPTIVRAFKAAATLEAKKSLGWKIELWRKNYFERVLRDGKEYADASRYILENPARWEWDKENRDRKHPPTRRQREMVD